MSLAVEVAAGLGSGIAEYFAASPAAAVLVDTAAVEALAAAVAAHHLGDYPTFAFQTL